MIRTNAQLLDELRASTDRQDVEDAIRLLDALNARRRLRGSIRIPRISQEEAAIVASSCRYVPFGTPVSQEVL